MIDSNNKITIQDIATLAGVAKSTVSRYLNNGYVSKEKAVLIDKVIKETGFKTNFFAQRLKAKSSKLIGIVMPRLDSYTAGKILSGINLIFTEKGYQPIILVSDLSKEKELSHIKKLINQGVDGIIVQSIGITLKHVKLVEGANIPIVFTGQSNAKVNFFTIDDYKAGKLIAEYLISLNHHRVAYLGISFSDEAVGKQRYQGFADNFLKKDVANTINFVETNFSFEQAYALGGKVMENNPTAVVCSTDNIALGLLRYLHEHCILVPDEVSIIGFGGYPIGEVSYPSLTSLAFDYQHLGAKAAEYLLALLNKQDIHAQYDSSMKLLTRESTATLR